MINNDEIDMNAIPLMVTTSKSKEYLNICKKDNIFEIEKLVKCCNSILPNKFFIKEVDDLYEHIELYLKLEDFQHKYKEDEEVYLIGFHKANMVGVTDKEGIIDLSRMFVKLIGKLFTKKQDILETDKINIGIIKEFTGGDKIQEERKLFCDYEEIKGRDKINVGIKELTGRDKIEEERKIRDNNIKLCRYLLNKEYLTSSEEREIDKITNFFSERHNKRDIIKSYSSDSLEEEKEHTEEMILFQLLERERYKNRAIYRARELERDRELESDSDS